MIPPLLTALWSYLRVRTFSGRVRDRAALALWQDRRLAAWLAKDVPRVDAFAQLRGQTVSLADLPVMDKATLMADFSRYTLPRITNAQGWAAFDGTRRMGDLTIGASTGTSGNRGLFVISEAERFAWLGAILAKAVPDVWRRRDRVAVLLPLDTPLYDSANQTGRLRLRFFDITGPVDSFAADLVGFAPTIIVAPPRILRRLTGLDLIPRRVFSAAEKLEEFDRTAIEAGFGVPLGQIYMATEGLLGVTCAQGRLHLAEDCLHFAFEPVGGGLVSPILSDFSRRTQIMARYRLNDLLRLDQAPCPCGSPLQVVAEVVGRADDIFVLPGPQGRVELTPDILRNAIVDADRGIDDFLLVQTGPAAMVLHLPKANLGQVGDKTLARLRRVLDRHGVAPGYSLDIAELTRHAGGKLRRVRRDFKG